MSAEAALKAVHLKCDVRNAAGEIFRVQARLEAVKQGDRNTATYSGIIESGGSGLAVFGSGVSYELIIEYNVIKGWESTEWTEIYTKTYTEPTIEHFLISGSSDNPTVHTARA